MKNDIYAMLNETNTNLENYEKKDFNDIEKKNIKADFRKSIKKRKSRKRNIIASGVFLAFSITLFGTNVGANALTNVLKIAGADDIGSFLGIHKNLADYKTVINKAITDNGITIKLNEVILDGNQINIFYNISSDEKLKNAELPHALGAIYMDNKLVFNGGGGFSKRIDDYNVQSLIIYDFGNKNLSGDLVMKIRFPIIFINGNEKEGTWGFEFKVNGDELKADTREMEINNKFTLGNGEEWTLEKYTDNSLGQKIYASVSNYKEKPSNSLVVSGTDNLNNFVEFNSYGSVEEGSAVFTKERYSEKLNENAKTLTLTPYVAQIGEEEGELEYKQLGKPFTIDLTQLK